MSLETALIDETAGSHALTLLKIARAWMKLKPRMSRPSPAQVLLHDAMHDRSVTRLKLKRHSECDIPSMVKDAGVVPELHELLVDRLFALPASVSSSHE